MSTAAITRRLENDLSLTHLLPAPRAATAQLQPRSPRHSAALWILSLAEGCERFGFYLLLVVFTLFLNERMGFSETRAAGWYGMYMAAIYATPVIGGAIAARFRSPLYWAQVGVLVLAVGYFAFGLASPWGVALAIGILVVGNGLFKPNINTLIGSLYQVGDARRDEAFGIFYFAVNAGGMLGPLVGELARRQFGWSAAFSLAGFALLGAGFTLLSGRSVIGSGSHSSAEAGSGTAAPQQRVAALLLLSVIMIPFWTAYHQHGSSLTFWARDGVDRAVWWSSGRWEIPPGWFAGTSAGFVLVLTPVIVAMGRWLRLSSIGKIIAGVVLGSASFGILRWATRESDAALVHPAWLLGHYLTMTLAELLLAPISLSLVSRLAPARWSGVMFGLWYAAAAVGCDSRRSKRGIPPHLAPEGAGCD